MPHTPIKKAKNQFSADLIKLFAEVGYDAMNAMSRVVFGNQDLPWASLSEESRQKYLDAAATTLWFCPSSESSGQISQIEPRADILSLWFGVDPEESLGEAIHGPGENPERAAQVAMISMFMNTIAACYDTLHEGERLFVSLRQPAKSAPRLKSV